MTIKICIFDAYGTLFDVNSAARRVASEPGREDFAKAWPAISESWRRKQLEYTWLRAITDQHTDFWAVTQDGLDWALEKHGGADDPELRERLLALYWELQAFPEVPEMLAELTNAGKTCAILSNGSPDMLNGAVSSAGLEELLDSVLSVETVGIFKPSSKVYDLVQEKYNVAKDEVLFVSSNGWDAAGATGYGFQTAWVNRGNDPVDRMPHRPKHILKDLSELAALVL